MSVPPPTGLALASKNSADSQAHPGERDRPPRVVMVIQRLRPYFSGQGVQLEGLCRELARRGVDATIVTAVRGQHPPREQADGFRVRRLRCDLPGIGATARSTRLWAPIFALRTLAYLWRHRRRVDLVHVHALTDALYASWLFTRLRRLPLLFEMTLLGADDPVSVQYSANHFRRLRYAVYGRCDGYVAISPALANSYRRAGLPAERMRMIPQGVDTQRFSPVADRSRLRAELELPTEVPLLVFVGSLIQRKGIDALLAAWRQVHASHPEAHLVLVGKNIFDDEAEAERFLRKQLADVPEAAAANVHEIGVSDRVNRYLQASDIFVFPSRREGFGTAIVEAMACALPCVVAELPGITDFVFGGDDGVVVSQDDARALAAEINVLLSEPQRAAEIGSAARQRAVEIFSFERIADSYLDYYDRLLKSRRSN